MHKNNHPIPNQLRRYRQDRGISQKQVARLLGVTNTSMISRWEKGRCFPSPVNLFRLAALYRTMVDALYWDVIQAARRALREIEPRSDTEDRA